ncbi:hypothetical protein LEP1GSC125_1999 [Leptospira mayottensis 200901122]|uniref:Uncharacterized protein n=2 Tax=Leptospira mayottensis TaxID=1137606 RepID=A0AA87MSF2_9LEPT|nr:hypothetical protein DQM28_16050 [Leptospira mayottensis]EKS01022.1 hypothetical protein LEP1GSC125_1999 [Leptospira mayottensis 200901122]
MKTKTSSLLCIELRNLIWKKEKIPKLTGLAFYKQVLRYGSKEFAPRRLTGGFASHFFMLFTKV